MFVCLVHSQRRNKCNTLARLPLFLYTSVIIAVGCLIYISFHSTNTSTVYDIVLGHGV